MLNVGPRGVTLVLFFNLLLTVETAAALQDQPDLGMGGHEVDSPERLRFIAHTHRQWLQEHFRGLRKDADRLLELTTELKSHSTSHSASVFDRDALKKIQKIEDLSHDLRKLMYNKSLPHIKTSGTNLVAKPQSSGGDEHSGIAPALTASWEMANYIHERMSAYLERVKQNTVSFSSEQEKAARDVVRVAGRLEGLAYELRHR